MSNQFLCSNCGLTLTGKTKLPTSPITGITGTSALDPKGLQKDAVLRVIQNAQPDLTRLDKEIARVTSILQQLSEERQALLHHVSIHRNLLSPIHRLPSELISDIFTRCLPDDYESPSLQSTPLVLGSICATWRAIASSTPKLWSRFCFGFGIGSPTPVARFLARARTYPLSLKIYLPTDKSSGEWIKLLASSQTRWQHVEFPDREAEHFPASIRRFKRLHALSFNTTHSHGGLSLDIFEGAPMLRALTINCGRPYETFTTSSKFPWYQLTFLQVRDGEPRWFYDILKFCPALVECHLKGEDNWVGNSAYPPLHLLQLRILSLCCNFSPYVRKLLNALTLPALQLMELRADFSSFPSLLMRSKCPLRAIRIIGLDLTAEDIFRVFALAPRLVDLDIHQWLTDPRPLPINSHPPRHGEDEKNPLVLQDLERVAYTCADEHTAFRLIDFVRSQWRMRDGAEGGGGVISLRQVRLRSYDGFQPSVAREVDKLRAEGLSITTITGHYAVPDTWDTTVLTNRKH